MSEIKKAVLFFLITQSISCQNDRANLTGHWHLKAVSEEGREFVSEFGVIDFENDTLAILGKNIGFSSGFYGHYSPETKEIWFGGECFYVLVHYKIEGEKLLLTQINDPEPNTEFIAEKCGIGCCDKQIEFFLPQKVAIDLPVCRDFGSCESIPDLSLAQLIYLGRPKPEYQKSNGTDISLELHHAIATAEELGQWNEKVKKQVPEQHWNQINYVIFADQSVLMNDLKPVLDFFQQNRINQVYIAMRGEETTDSLMLHYKNLSHQFPG
ncbi:MAG TPA: hypothetical protein PKE06_18780 [Flavilitoribacter sp.]|nr:hypothetical protein [Flavilitoribacter sp.]HMQ91011.1 hypothetical protein [Flavilitoribacter sp.]